MSHSDEVVEVPKWDVALESLISEEYRKKGEDLTNEDFTRLAKAHAIRYDDIMETVFSLCISGVWTYLNAEGDVEEITREQIDKLYVNARLVSKDLREFTGGWRPLS